ncbi:MAG: DNA/RNA nuclease SfsA [Bacillota bacterium]
MPPDLREALFVLRLNRFVAEIELDGRRERAHVPSSGRMGELLYPGARVYVAPQTRPGVRLGYRILLAEKDGLLVSVDSLLPNRLVHRLLMAGAIEELSGYSTVKKEVAYGRGRFDFFLGSKDRPGCFLEVKSVTLVEGGVALFPDAPSLRGARHLEELAAACGEGYRPVVMFVIQRPDAEVFSPNRERDPEFSRNLAMAAGAGVEVIARRCVVSLESVLMEGPVPVVLR